MHKINCKNCGHSVAGQFCSNCGQKSSVDRINLSNFLEEISTSIFLVNKGILYTTKELFIRPGKSIEEYLDGKRKIHFKPVAYVIAFSTLYFLITKLSGENTWMNEILIGLSSDKDSTVDLPPSLTWLANNFAYAALFSIPFFSLASYLSFLGFKKNYLEHLVLNAYIAGQQSIFYSFFITLKVFIDSEVLEVIPVFISTIYTFWVFWQFFSEGNRFVNILRTLLSYLLYLILTIGIIFTISYLYKAP